MPLHGQAGFGGVGPALTAPQLPSKAAAAPQEQLGLWSRFRQKLQDDPNFKMALLTTGFNMMRSPNVMAGENFYDVFADAATTGVGTLDQLRQRDITRESIASKEERETKRIGLEERRTAAAESTAASGASQRAEQIKVARERLAEDKRQFGIEQASGRAGTTGQERMQAGVVKALQDANPEEFPDTEAGHAKALLVAAGLAPGSVDPARRAHDIITLYSEISRGNPYRDDKRNEEEMQSLAEEIYTRFLGAGDVTQAAAEEEAADPEGLAGGSALNYAGTETGIVEYIGTNADGKNYVVKFQGGSTKPMTAAQARSLMGDNSVN